jgi:hypothetical protein
MYNLELQGAEHFSILEWQLGEKNSLYNMEGMECISHALLMGEVSSNLYFITSNNQFVQGGIGFADIKQFIEVALVFVQFYSQPT